MASDFLQLGVKWPLESKCYFEACNIAINIHKTNKTILLLIL